MAAATRRHPVWLASLVAALMVLMTAGASAAEPAIHLPLRVDRQAITVRAEAGMERWLGRVAETAPGKLRAIRADLEHLPGPARVEIRLVKRAADLSRAAPPGYRVPSWASGVAFPREGVVVVAARRGAHNIDVVNVVTHELAHMALGAALRGRAPRWLDEGFAYLHSSDWSMERWRTLVGMAWTGNAIPWRELDGRFPEGEQQAAKAYAQSYDMVAFLAHRGKYKHSDDDGDRWPFQKFLMLIGQGHTPDQAARVAYLSSLDELYAEWYSRLRQRYLLMPVGLFALGIWVLGALLLIVAYIRRRRVNRRRLDQWAEDEDALAATARQNV